MTDLYAPRGVEMIQKLSGDWGGGGVMRVLRIFCEVTIDTIIIIIIIGYDMLEEK